MSKSNPYAPKNHTTHDSLVATVVEENPVVSGTVKEVLEWVGEDEERAQRALEAEEAGAKRKTLLDALGDILG